MADERQLEILSKGVGVWNRWREENRHEKIDLKDAYLRGVCLSKINLKEANLSAVNLRDADLSEACLKKAYFSEAYLSGAKLRDADLSGAYLSGAYLTEADLSGANLKGAWLKFAILNKTILDNAILVGCRIYGISVWDIKTNNTTMQKDLIITQKDESTITVDNIEVAQFIYLLLNNQKIRGIINTITSKVVLILGRFTPERKTVLDAMREDLRRKNYLPVMFDFDKPHSRDTKETILTLAGMARFVIADITEPRCIPMELITIASNLPSLPILVFLQEGQEEFGMFDSIRAYQSVLDIKQYKNEFDLISNIHEKSISAVEEWIQRKQKV